MVIYHYIEDTNMDRINIMIDTDIGDDIDDAFALVLALSEPKLNVIGITTVYRNTILRAKQVKKLLDVLKKDIPVYAGVELPIKEEIHLFKKDKSSIPSELIPCQFETDYNQYLFSNISGVDAIINNAYQYEGELIVACIGPLTNMAYAIKKDPEIVNKIRKIVIMGGDYERDVQEWNIYCDPEAADIVFKSGIPVDCIGLNVTEKCQLDKHYLDELRSKKNELSTLLVQWLDKWFDYFNFSKSVLHDPLAITSIFADVCKFKTENVNVELINKRGSINKDSNSNNRPHHIRFADSVNKELFFEIFKHHVIG